MTKHKERAAAFQALYSMAFSPVKDELELQKIFKRSCLSKKESAEENEAACAGFAWKLTRGVWENEESLNRLIEKYSRNWRLERIGLLEQILLRLGLYEMRDLGMAPRVVMAESMALADDFGAVEAKSFVNGVLDAAARDFGLKI